MGIVKLTFILSVILIAEISLHTVSAQCDIPFTSVGDECYYFSWPSKAATFVEAQESCEQMGSTLAIIDTEEKQNAITPYIMEYAAELNFFIGGYNLGHNNTYIWNAIGQPLTYTNFIMESTGEYCIVTSSGFNAQWKNEHCQTKEYFICQKVSNSCYDSASETTCNGSYTLVNGKCYEFVTEKELKWIEAKEYCERREAVLAILDSEEINSQISTIIAKSFNTHTFWIGTYDQSHEGRWVWDGKGTKISYSNWYPGQPDGGTEENCAAIGNTSVSNAWESINCNEVNNFICQKLPDSCGVAVRAPEECSCGRQPNCVPPFTDYGGACFFILPGDTSPGIRFSWFDAVDLCHDMGAKLGYILNEQEQAALTAVMTTQTFSGMYCAYWIGLNDLNNDGIWTWEGIDRPANYTAWVTGFPNKRDYNCAYANADCDTYGEWANEVSCSSRMLIICRK